MSVTYGIIKEIYDLGENSRVSYGISAYDVVDGSVVECDSVHDITSDKDKLIRLVELCNNLNLSIIHLHDIVEDFLVG